MPDPFERLNNLANNESEVSTAGNAGDPEGQYPKAEYWFKSSITKEDHVLNISGDPTIDIADIMETTVQTSTDYTDANVKQTASGHVLLFDDKHGSRRILLKHENGTGIEMRNDGTMVMRTENNIITSVGGSGVLMVEGDLKVSCKNLEIDATGDLDMRVEGDYNLNVQGDKREFVQGISEEAVKKNKYVEVVGNMHTDVVKNTTSVHLGDVTNVVKGKLDNSVQGDFNMNARGSAHFSSMMTATFAAPNTNISAEDLTVVGAGGTIGGENMIYYGKNYYGLSATYTGAIKANGITSISGSTLKGIKGAAFTGDVVGNVNGTAAKAQNAGTANTLTGGSAVAAPTYVGTAATNPDTTETAQPTTTILTDYLGNSDRGIQKVVIDAGDHIKNKIDLTAATGGKTKTELSVKQIRAKIKDDNNAADDSFLKYIYGREKINPEFNKKIPTNVGRSFDGSQAYTPFENMNGPTVSIKSQRHPKELLPDSRYNPIFIRQTATWHQQSQATSLDFIDSKTLVGYGIPISTFLDGPISELDFTTDLNKKTRLDLAKQLVLQAEVIKFAKNTPQFANDYHLVVEEGVYISEAGENLKEGSIPDLAKTGRAIVYAMYNTPGGRATYESIKTDLTASFEFATRLASSLFAYDKIILNYDNIGEFLHAQIIVTMPEVDDSFKFVTTPTMGLETRFNNKVLSNTDLVEIAESYSVKTRKEPLSSVGTVIYNVVGQTRDKKVKLELEEALAFACGVAKVDFVTITSGAQPGSDGKRIGSFRHDTGLAADFTLTKDGRLLSAASVQDQAVMSEFLGAAKVQGVLAGGMSRDYMGNNTMHLDMLGAQNHRTSGYDKKTIITWKSDAWFVYAMNN